MHSYWLLSIVSQDWFDRYSHRFEQYRLPKTKAEQLDLALVIGRDGHQLLMAVYSTNTPTELASVSAVEILRSVWVQQYYLQGENLSWRTDDLPPNQLLIQSPYDIQARNRTKRNTNWTGYSVHLTETCDCELPSLITNVETTHATTFDGAMTPIIHQHLADKALLPQEHFVDTNYVSAQHLLDSKQNYQLELTGPVTPSGNSKFTHYKFKIGIPINKFRGLKQGRRFPCAAPERKTFFTFSINKFRGLHPFF